MQVVVSSSSHGQLAVDVGNTSSDEERCRTKSFEQVCLVIQFNDGQKYRVDAGEKGTYYQVITTIGSLRQV
jgi:hypothetical protein